MEREELSSQGDGPLEATADRLSHPRSIRATADPVLVRTFAERRRVAAARQYAKEHPPIPNAREEFKRLLQNGHAVAERPP
jgi:hypothetical protein